MFQVVVAIFGGFIIFLEIFSQETENFVREYLFIRNKFTK
jgi:hypothetical protein